MNLKIKKSRYTAIFIYILILHFSLSLIDAEITEPGVTNQTRSIAIEQLKDKVRVTVRCSESPNIGVFSVESPPKIIVDFVDVQNKLTEAEVTGPKLYPIKAIRPSQWKEMPLITRVEIELEVAAPFNVERQENLVAIDIDANPPILAPRESEELKFEPTVSMYVKDAEIVDILRMLAAQFSLNIITTMDVKGLITVRIQDIPLYTAFDALVKAAECNFIKYSDGLILVKPIKKELPGELQTRVFELKHTEANDIKEALKNVISREGNVEFSFRRVAKGSGSERSSVLVVTDRAENMAEIEKVIRSLDLRPPQIVIMAKLIETSQSAQDLFGINWNLTVSAVGQITEVPAEGEPVQMPILVNNLILGTIDFGNMSAILSFLQTKGKGRLLCEPQITTLDNQTALIELSTKYPQPTVEINPQTGAQSVRWTQLDIPIELVVTPHATADGTINTNIEVTVEAITGWIPAPIAQGGEQPIIASRRAQTQVAVKNGEVIVIGGLTKDEVVRTKSRLPILGYIPILGDLLFSQTSTRTEKNNLIIFIAPQVINSQG
ncbi:MAG: AMIN domain-containing protein [candidate division WOR-3 bacterium]|nr:AMIN domain-containing protein [candidate division WOR-3 bacterium]